MKKLVTAVMIGLALILLMGGRAATQAPYQLNNQLNNQVSPDFSDAALSTTSSHPQLTEAQAIQLVSSTYWDLSKATAVSASYKSWTPVGLLTRVSGGALEPYGTRTVWLVVAHGVRVYDPGGAPGECNLQPATPSNCAALRTWDNIMFIVDDAAKKVIEATPF